MNWFRKKKVGEDTVIELDIPSCPVVTSMKKKDVDTKMLQKIRKLLPQDAYFKVFLDTLENEQLEIVNAMTTSSDSRELFIFQGQLLALRKIIQQYS